jgi:hypothetical protein
LVIIVVMKTVLCEIQKDFGYHRRYDDIFCKVTGILGYHTVITTGELEGYDLH